MTDLSDFFGADSPLRRCLPGFKPRAGQAWMAEAVRDAIASREKLVVEAGTGTGKTFAYLLPALLSGARTIISTGTKALQDQLFHRDLPELSKAVGRPGRAALLKGRANYLCLYRLDLLDRIPHGLEDDVRRIHEWRHRTGSGDRGEMTEVAEESPVWPMVTSTPENCLGQKCPRFSDCFVVKARRAAQEVDLVVVNHHLLLADLAMKESGFVEFLPGADAIILDEAHQIPDLAAQFFGVSLGSRELERLVDELAVATAAFRQPEQERRVEALRTAIRVLRALAPRAEGRYPLEEVLPDLSEPLDRLRLTIDDTIEALAAIPDDAVGPARLVEQLCAAAERLSLLVNDESWDGLRWLEINPRSLRLNLTPLDVSGTIGGLIGGADQAWIFTSATLAIEEDFSHFTERLGLRNARALRFPSPFAMARNALVYLPPDLPPPSSREHTAAMLDALVPLLGMTGGGVFCLFTSHRALNEAVCWFGNRKSLLADRPLLVQGSAPRDDLLCRFRAAGKAVLLGTGSFWEGVDVRGPALTVVAIDKLPFASPADPLLMARLAYIRQTGGNGFADHQLPQAVLALKQGVGRLLRDTSDYGVVVLCDPRITSRPYGRLFLKSLEPMPSTADLEAVRRFFEAHEASGAVA